MLCQPSRFSCSVSGSRLHVATAVRERFLYKNKQIKQYKNQKQNKKENIKKDNDPVGYLGNSLTVHNPCKM